MGASGLPKDCGNAFNSLKLTAHPEVGEMPQLQGTSAILAVARPGIRTSLTTFPLLSTSITRRP